MNGVHDMGGMHGMGPIEREKNEPVFHERWESRIFAIRRAMRPWGAFKGKANRYHIEMIPAAEQLRLSYYARHVVAFSELIAESGLVTAAEIATGKRARRSPKAVPLLKADQVAAFLAKGAPASRNVAVTPRFLVGQTVRARNIHPIPWPALGVLMFGLVILYGVGFSTLSQAHNATHDTRHANGFPCH